MKEKKKGRPYAKGYPRNIKITVMLNEEEHIELQKKAKEKGLTMSEYLRKKI